MKAVIITTLGLLLSSGLAYAADNPPLQGQSPSGPTSGHPTVLTDTECNGVWMDAASGGDVLTGDKAGGYISDFKQADADQDGKISQTEFKEACKKGLIKPEHAESAKMGKDVGTHPGGAGEAPPVESGKIQGQ
jgi:EF hand domain-containing protein